MGIEIRGMAPLLQVFDMPTSIAFYRDVLGFEVVTTSKPGAENFGWALLRLNGMELMLNTAYEEDSRPPEPVPKVAPYGMKQLYVRDPDGYNLCFQWPGCVVSALSPPIMQSPIAKTPLLRAGKEYP